jgi:hypothetical protein
MRFVLFTDKTVSQCTSAINERINAKGSKSRPELDGWIEKGGIFSVSVTSNVFRRFPRTTRLSAKAERDGKITIIRGAVAGGIGPKGLRILVVFLLIVSMAIMISGQPMLTLVVFIVGGLALLPLHGDYINSEILLIEVERALKASPIPPKKANK